MTEMILAPSILSADFAALGDQIEEADKAGAQYIHIDVMDGLFVPSISFGMPVIRSIRCRTKKVFDVHLMIERPERYIKEFADCGADLITFHLEACDCIRETIELIHSQGVKAGLSVKPATPVEALRSYLDVLDMVLIMSVEPGFGGQKYIPSSTDKLREAKRLIGESGRDIDLQVDGGIKLENIRTVYEAGANVIVAGSSVFGGNVAENVKALMMAASGKTDEIVE